MDLLLVRDPAAAAFPRKREANLAGDPQIFPRLYCRRSGRMADRPARPQVSTALVAMFLGVALETHPVTNSVMNKERPS
jgi:hypothetical protein